MNTQKFKKFFLLTKENTYHSMSESQNNYSELRNKTKKEYPLYDSMYNIQINLHCQKA